MAAMTVSPQSSVPVIGWRERVALPELERLKYAPRLATGTLAAGGTLGILIPPSIALVLYAIIVEASVIEMFQAAIWPDYSGAWFWAVYANACSRHRGHADPPIWRWCALVWRARWAWLA